MSNGEVSEVKVHDIVCFLGVYKVVFRERGEMGWNGCLRFVEYVVW